MKALLDKLESCILDFNYDTVDELRGILEELRHSPWAEAVKLAEGLAEIPVIEEDYPDPDSDVDFDYLFGRSEELDRRIKQARLILKEEE